jgi:hypothetical protein
MMRGITVETTVKPGLCAACGIPVDSQYFDDSSVQPAPALGQELVLAHFDLPAQYCGVLQYFCQFTDSFGDKTSKIATPTIEWKILVNSHALFPYINLRQIVNPWGYGSYPVNIRLDGGSTVELVARGVTDDKSLDGAPAASDPAATVIGGRIVGRFWYNASFGDIV